MTKARGNPEASIVFVIPPPSEEECSVNKLMSDNKGRDFAHILLLHGGFSLFQDALVMPINFCAIKPLTSTHKNCQRFINPLMQKAELVCLVGNDVYRAYFNEGGMPELLRGRDMGDARYPWKFFFFSDYRKMEDYFEESGEEYWQRRIVTECRCFGACVKEMRK